MTVYFEMVGYIPARPAQWHGAPPFRSPGETSRFLFAFVDAEADDPDEAPLSPTEVAALACWFAAGHDRITEHAADRLRDGSA